MQVEGKAATSVAKSPFGPSDDPAADFVLQTSDNVRFWLCKAVVARASPIFKDMFSVPHPPQDPDAAPEAPDSEYVDAKPVVRVTEDAAIVDIFMRCCYPVLRPALEAKQLTTMLEMGDKYDAIAVRGYARQEVARYALRPEHCVRAYLIAYRYGMIEEMHVAARQTIQLRRQALLSPVLPEHSAVPATALTALQIYRQQCLAAVTRRCTLEACVEYYSDTYIPLWDIRTKDYRPSDAQCTCDVMAKKLVGTLVSLPDPPDDDDDLGFAAPDTRYIAKTWVGRCLFTLRQSIARDDMSIRQALFDSEAIEAALKEADECKSCQKGAAKALVGLLNDIDASMDRCISHVPFEEKNPRGKKRAHEE